MKTNLLFYQRGNKSSNLKNAGFMLVLILSFIFANSLCFAQEVADGTWAANLLPTTATADITIINDAGGVSATVTLGANVDMAGFNLTIGNGANVNAIVINLAGYSITNIGAFTMNNGTSNGTVQFADGTISCNTFAGFDAANDIITLNGGSLIVATGDITIPAAAQLTTSGTATITATTGNVVCTAADALVLGGTTAINAPAGAITLGAVTLTAAGSTTLSAAVDSDITLGGVVTGAGAETVTIAQGDLVVNGNISAINNLTFSGSDVPDVTINAALTANLKITTATLNINNLTIGGTAVTTFFLPAGITINIAGDLNINGSGAAATLTLNNGNTIDVEGATTINAAAATLASALAGNVSTINFNGLFTPTANPTLAATLAGTTININAGLGANWQLPATCALGGLLLNDSDGSINGITLATGAGTATIGNLTITKGKFTATDAGAAQVLSLTNLTIANDADATLDISGGGGAFTCTATLSGSATFGTNGNFTTNATTIITAAAGLAAVTLPSSITTLAALNVYTANGVTLGGNLATPSVTLFTGTNHGKLTVGSGNTLTLTLAAALTISDNIASILNIDDASLIINETGQTLTGLNLVTFQTNSASDFYLTADSPLTLSASFDEVENFTFVASLGATLTLGGNLHVYGYLKLDGSTAAPTLHLNGKNLTVDGLFNTSAHASIITVNATGSTVNFNGAIDFSQFTLTATNSTNITIGGSGTITGNFLNATMDLGNLTFNRSGATLNLVGTTGASAHAIKSLTVTNGTVVYADNENADDALTIAGNVTVGAGGSLVLGATTTVTNDVFVTLCTGAGAILKVDGTLTLLGSSTMPLGFTLGSILVESGKLQVSGSFATNEYVNVTLNMGKVGGSKTEQLNLPATFTKCKNFTLHSNATATGSMAYTVVLQNDMEIAGDLVITGLTPTTETAVATLKTGTNTLTVTGATTINAGAILDASAGNVVFKNTVTIANDASAKLLFNSATNAEFQNNIIVGTAGIADIYELNNLILNGPNDDTAINDLFKMKKALVCHGNLEVYLNNGGSASNADGDVLVTDGYDITVYGDLVVDDKSTAAADNADECIRFSAGTDLYLYGNMSDGGSTETNNLYENTNAISLHILEDGEGTALQFTLPTGLVEVKSVELVRTAGMALMSGDFTIGTVLGGKLTITRGNFDLNGKNNILLGGKDVAIVETGGKIVNNGVDGGYVKTALACSKAQIIASGIGVMDIEDGTNTGYAIFRYPKMTVVEGDFDTRISARRYYGVISAATVTDVTFRIDDDELGDNSFAGLDVYYKPSAVWTNFTTGVTLYDDDSPHADVNLVHTPTTNGYGTLRVQNPSTTGAAFASGGAMFAFASQRATNGMIYTFTGAANTLWNDQDNWSGGVVPSIDDDVVINTPVLVSANANAFEVASIIFTGTGSLRPTVGQQATVRVMGNIELTTANNYIDAVNGTGRLAFIFGKEDEDPISLDLKPANNYGTNKGIRFHDVQLINANVLESGDYNIVSTGDLALEGVSVFDASAGTFTFNGSTEAAQALTVSGTETVSLKNLVGDNNAKVTTNADISISSKLYVTQAGCSFIQANAAKDVFFDLSGGSADITGWHVFKGAYCQLDNINITISDNNIAPYGDVYVGGDFSFASSGTGAFNHNSATSHPDGNAVIFSNTTATSTIGCSGDATLLNFDEIKVLENCNVNTVSDFYIRRSINVEDEGEFIANAGTIYLKKGTNVDKVYIENLSNHTLEFYNLDLNCANTVYTTSDFTVQGNLNNQDGSTLNCYDGTITFANNTTKTITNGTGSALNFHAIAVPAGSRISTTASFNITNNGDEDEYKADAGITVNGSGVFRQTAGVCTFKNLSVAVQSNPGAGNPKTITVDSDATLDLYNIVIANEPNNDVVTESDFRIGGGATTLLGARTTPAFENQSANVGGTFTASNGSTITFDGDHPLLSTGTQTYTWVTIKNTNARNAVVFDNLALSGMNLELLADNYLVITGDIIVDGDATIENPQFVQADNAAATKAYLLFNGDEQQKLTGNSTNDTPVSLNGIEIDKSNTTSTMTQEVLMEVNTKFTTGANSALYLTDGYLNVGTKTLTLNAPASFVQSAASASSEAAINGGSGTIFIAANMLPALRFLRDYTFTVKDEPTLYNLYINVAEELENSLTINNDLTLNAALNITGATLTVKGDIALAGNPAAATDYFVSDATGTLKLIGTGSIAEFSNEEYMGASGHFPFNLYLGREEILSGDVTLGASAVPTQLILNCGVNTVSLADNTLNLQYVSDITRISGSITAGTSSTVIWSKTDMNMPSNFFANEECGTLNLEPLTDDSFTIEGDLTINTELIGIMDIYTGNNILEFSASCNLGDFTSAEHIIGNLRRTIAGGKRITFALGDGSAASYRPLTLTAKSTLTQQTILVSTANIDPTYGRGGNPDDAIDVLWSITPEGTIASDDIKMEWSWGKAMETGGHNATSGRVLAASWDNTQKKWTNYYSNLESFILTNPNDMRVVNTQNAVIPMSKLSGDWTIFATDAPDASITDVDTGLPETNASQRDDAISTGKNIVKITKITNLPVGSSVGSEITVQLQDQYGQPITTSKPFEFTVTEIIGNNGWLAYTNVIPAGSTSKKFPLNYTIPASRIQLVADTATGSDRWSPSASEVFANLANTPGVQANNINITKITASSANISFNNGLATNTIVLVNADGLIDEANYPKNGTTYTANALIGAGSAVGNASVIYNSYKTKGTVNNVSLYGLAPMTTYYVYALNYADATSGAVLSKGSEAYVTKSGIGNPKEFTTTGTQDDDLSYGSNDTRATAKPIGTNSPVRGTIGKANDEDWYCFTVTGATSNVRATLSNLPANYNFELYDISNLRLRRAIRNNTSPEAMVINYMQPGTYLVRIYGVNGAYDASRTYELMIETKGSKVYSVSK